MEAALQGAWRPWDRLRVDYALRQHEQWYKGDGAYGDGPSFHWDYYNSFVIHPMLVDVLDGVRRRRSGMAALRPQSGARATRYAAASSNGWSRPTAASRHRAIHRIPLRGVSAAGAARAAARPAGRVSPAQAREALGAVIRPHARRAGTFDATAG